ncbi:hypothetical protein TUM19329_27010 [Legionella antarctica]|uniref:IcmL-like protein n=1 Tax=Legionella antarctica TaxID=2708020 RepID=A0A6F8T871_9GAMM|nr:DotI/IcmL family type IV secretion protein [Legionella antarctica]BCA96340.1 hypothetical protein TUM19329_27010 [Legionella antarctica]
MKKIILIGALFNLTSTPLIALHAPDTFSKTIAKKANSSVSSKMPPRPVSMQKQKTSDTKQEQHSNLKHSSPNLSSVQTIQDPSVELQKEAIIDCDSRISAETLSIDRDFILSWAEHAVTQSFDFNLASLDTQLQKLQACYTKKGWVGFTDALKKSGNIDAIKTQNLIVSSRLDGQAQLINVNDNQWKITLPLKVVYHNDIEEETHFLNIYLTIGWKNAFALGITQMIATPRTAPLAHKASTLRDALQSIYFAAANKEYNWTQQIATSFLVSLFPKKPRNSFPRADIIYSQADWTLKGQKKTPTRHVSHLAQLRPSPASQYGMRSHQILTAQNKMNLIVTLPEKTDSNIINGLKLASDQMLNFKSIFLARLQNVQEYGERGLDEFHTAVKKLNYLEAIKTSQLTVNSQKDRHPQLVETQNNQWKMSLPMQVVYQNDRNKVTQLLNVNLTVARTSSGELAITQINATPNGTSSQLTQSHSFKIDKASNQKEPRSGSAQKIEAKNTLQLTQSDTADQPTQVSQSTSSASNIGLEPVQKLETINCNYKISPETKNIDEAFVLSWAVQAAIQSFDFNFLSLDTQLHQLESCYTEKGWKEFKNAMQKTGNIEAIKTQKLTAISQMDGRAQLIESKNNQWKISLPLHVIYQNDKGDVTQLLNVNLIVGRRSSGELGIMHLNSSLRDAPIAFNLPHS